MLIFVLFGFSILGLFAYLGIMATNEIIEHFNDGREKWLLTLMI